MMLLLQCRNIFPILWLPFAVKTHLQDVELWYGNAWRCPCSGPPKALYWNQSSPDSIVPNAPNSIVVRGPIKFNPTNEYGDFDGASSRVAFCSGDASAGRRSISSVWRAASYKLVSQNSCKQTAANLLRPINTRDATRQYPKTPRDSNLLGSLPSCRKTCHVDEFHEATSYNILFGLSQK